MNYKFFESVRLVVAAMMITGSYSLLLGENIFMGLLAQALWMAFENNLLF